MITRPSEGGPTVPPRLAVLARAVYPWHGMGGLERHVHDLVIHLLERGVHVTLITPPSRQPEADGLRHARLTAVAVPYRTFPGAGRRWTTVIDRATAYPVFGYRAGRVAARLAAAGQVDVVYGVGASALGYALARRRHRSGTVPFIFNPQGLEEFGATDPRRAGFKRVAYRPLQLAVRACARAADRVIATDRTLSPVVVEHLDVPGSRVRLLPNAVDVGACDGWMAASKAEALRRDVRLGPADPLLLSTGRIEQNKGLDVLAHALGGLLALEAGRRSLGASWRWVHVGDGPFRKVLERRVATLGLERQCVLRGRVSEAELHGWYDAATLFVHPTLYEGSSLVTLEAMAHRLAVVATSAGGLPDKVTPGATGWLVEPGNAEALTQALIDALRDPARLPAMGQAGRAAVEREFSWTTVTQRFLDLVDELTGDTASTSPGT